jgi:ABC-type transport system substrate-binding protein
VTSASRRGLPRALVLAGAALAVLVAGCLAACSGDGDGAGKAPGTSEGDTPPGVAKEGGTLRLGLGGPIVVDPERGSPATPTDQMVLDLLHDGLTVVGPDGQVAAALARDWSADPAFQTWRFTVDPAATFTDGHPVTATDVVASLEHVIAGGDSSLAALRLEPVQGFRAFLDGTAPNVAGLRAVDASTVQINLTTPLALLPELLAAPAYGIVDLASVTDAANGDLTELDLSGGWKVAEAEAGRLLLQRRDGSIGHLDAIELRAYPDLGRAYSAFVDGDVDWAPVPSDQFGAAVKGYGSDHLTPFQAELDIGLRVDGPVLANGGIRRAIAAAIDREAIVRAVYPDLADSLSSVVPSGVVGHNPARCTSCAHDPEHARTLVTQAFPDGLVPELSIDFDASPAQQAMAEIVSDSLKAVGIPTVLHPLPLGEYQRYLVSGGQQIFTFGWIAGDRTPDAYLSPLFQSMSPDNLVGLRSPDVDGLLAQARATADPAAAGEAWAQAERLLLEDAVVIPIAQFRTQVVVSRRVVGLVHSVDGTVDWASVALARDD